MLSFKKKQKQTNKETNVIICEEQPLLSVNYFFLMISYYCSAFISHVKKKKKHAQQLAIRSYFSFVYQIKEYTIIYYRKIYGISL